MIEGEGGKVRGTKKYKEHRTVTERAEERQLEGRKRERDEKRGKKSKRRKMIEREEK